MLLRLSGSATAYGSAVALRAPDLFGTAKAVPFPGVGRTSRDVCLGRAGLEPRRKAAARSASLLPQADAQPGRAKRHRLGIVSKIR